MISYTIQCTLSIASIIALIPLFFLQRKMYESFGALTHSYTLANWWFSMAVFVSAAVLYSQGPLFSERMILKSVAQLQLRYLLISGGMWILFSWYKYGIPLILPLDTRVWWNKDLFSCVYKILIPLSISIVCSRLLWKTLDGLEEIAVKIKHDNPVINEHTEPCIFYLVQHAQEYSLFIPCTTPEKWTYGIAGVATAVAFIFSLFKRYRNMVCYAFFVFLPSLLGTSVLQTILLVQLFNQRKQIRAIAEDDYADNEWGFGQLLSMFTWVPILFEGGLWICKAIVHWDSKCYYTEDSILFLMDRF